MKRLIILPATLFALSALAAPLRLAPGASAPITLVENPSTGYSWRLDREESQGLDRVAIADLGHSPGASMPGAPGSHRWTIRAKQPGTATLVFVYQRPWEPEPVETRNVVVVIAPR